MVNLANVVDPKAPAPDGVWKSGKKQRDTINKLRSDWTEGRGGEEAWGQYHDKFLSYGSPPVPLIREQMLGEDYDGDTALLPH